MRKYNSLRQNQWWGGAEFEPEVLEPSFDIEEENGLVFTFEITEEYVNQKIALYLMLGGDAYFHYNVDWGDGTIDSNVDGLTGVYPHAYTSSGTYNCVIYNGNVMFSAAYLGGAEDQNCCNCLKYILVKGVSPIAGVYNINPTHYLNNLVKLKYIALDKMFNGIYMSDMPDSISHLFEGCVFANKISEEFFRAMYVQVCNYSYCFANCKSVPSIDENIGNWIQNTSDIDISYMFQNCTNISGKLPELWLTHGDTIHAGCFNGCVNASNYSEVPSDWK